MIVKDEILAFADPGDGAGSRRFRCTPRLAAFFTTPAKRAMTC